MNIIQTDIEGEILRLSDLLEAATVDYALALSDSAAAQHVYRRDFAMAFARHRLTDRQSEKTSEQLSTVDCEEQLSRRLSTEAIARGLEEKCRSLREQIGGVRTLSANVRVQT